MVYHRRGDLLRSGATAIGHLASMAILERCVFDMHGRVVALLSAVNDEPLTERDRHCLFPAKHSVKDVSFLIPIQDVFDNIQKVTGHRPEVV